MAGACDLLAGATLDDLTAFITAARLSRVSGVSGGAIYSAFAPGPGVGGATRSGPQAAARHTFIHPSYDADAVTQLAMAIVEAAVVQGNDGTTGLDLPAVTDSIADLVLEGVDGSLARNYSQLWLAAAVALNDPEIRQVGREEYRSYFEGYGVMVAELLRLSGREPLEGTSVDQLAAVLVTAVDGAVLQLRFDPDLGRDHTVRLVLGLWAGLTRPVGDPDDLLERRVAGPLSGPVTAEEAPAVEAAVRRLHDRAGWGAVSLRKVAQLSGVPVVRLATRYPDRHHLAPVVWAGLSSAVAGADRAPGTGPAGRVVAMVMDLADMACSHRALAASLLRARLCDGAVTGGTGADPVVDPLVGALAAALDAAGWGDGDGGTGRAATIVDAVVVRAATSEVRAEDLARQVLGGLLPDGLPGHATGPAGATGQ